MVLQGGINTPIDIFIININLILRLHTMVTGKCNRNSIFL